MCGHWISKLSKKINKNIQAKIWVVYIFFCYYEWQYDRSINLRKGSAQGRPFFFWFWKKNSNIMYHVMHILLVTPSHFSDFLIWLLEANGNCKKDKRPRAHASRGAASKIQYFNIKKKLGGMKHHLIFFSVQFSLFFLPIILVLLEKKAFLFNTLIWVLHANWWTKHVRKKEVF